MNKPTIGRIVHYCLSEKDNAKRSGELRPAIVTAVFPDEFGAGAYGVNLHVFTDGYNDFADERGSRGIHVYSAQLVDGAPVDGQCAWPEVTR